jgi:peptide/nickel transport system permease protein
MTKYVARAALGILPTLLILTFLVSFMVRLIPGTAVDVMLTDSGASRSERAALTHQLGLDRNIFRQYADYLRGVRDGSLGHSVFNHRAVTAQIQGRILPSVELSVWALLISWSLGISVGLLSAVRRNSLLDYVLRIAVNGFLGIPNFVLAAIIITLPAYYLGWTPPLTYVSLPENPLGNLAFYLAPSIVLGVGLAASIARVTRTTTLEVLHQDYVRTARAKGLGEFLVLRRHLLRNALVPVLALSGLQVAALVSGVVIIEQVFSIPGVGTFLLQAIRNRDYPLVQGVTLLVGLLVILLNLLIDILHPLLDPRIHM